MATAELQRKKRRKAKPKQAKRSVLTDAIETAARRLSAGDAHMHNTIYKSACTELARIGELYPLQKNGLPDPHEAWVLVGFVEADEVVVGLRWQDGVLCNCGHWHGNAHYCTTDLQGMRVD